MQHTRTPRLGGKAAPFLGLATLAALGLAAPAAHAQDVLPVMLTLDDPFQVVAVPGSGTTTVDFTGTLSVAKGYVFSGGNLDFPFSATNVPLLSSFGSLDLSSANNGGTAHGLLFTVAVPAGTAPDFYGFHFGPSGPSVFQVSVNDGNGGTDSTATTDFSVTATPAPEPSAFAGLAMGALGLGGLGWKARRRA